MAKVCVFTADGFEEVEGPFKESRRGSAHGIHLRQSECDRFPWN